MSGDAMIECSVCGWRHVVPCGRDDCPHDVATPATRDEDPATTELLAALDDLYPLLDDDRRVERAGRTCAVLKRWMAYRETELHTLIPKLMQRFMVGQPPVAIAEIQPLGSEGLKATGASDRCLQCETTTATLLRLREALEKYGAHRLDCLIDMGEGAASPCSCGFSAALTRLPASEQTDLSRQSPPSPVSTTGSPRTPQPGGSQP